MRIKTLHGTFCFAQQRFLLSGSSGSSARLDRRYLRDTGQRAESAGLREFCLSYCNRLSFCQVISLVRRVSGAPLVCEQTLWNWVQEKAAEVDAALCAQVASAQDLPFPELADSVDLYDAASPEVLVLADGIGVKAQKPSRESSASGASKTKKIKTVKRVDTDVMLIQGRQGSFRYLSAGLGSGDAVGRVGRGVSLTDVAEAYLRQEWGEWSQKKQSPLPIVALTDGARGIRRDLERLFGASVTVILDWYHLAKRVYEHLSMIAHSTQEREGMQQQILGWLWRGQTEDALGLLSEVSARNAKALAELVGYLDKHKAEIIDYERRAQTGKWIGSGRMEKGVDQVVGMRQKKKGMSWSRAGSRALALLKIVELNGEWERLWAGATSGQMPRAATA